MVILHLIWDSWGIFFLRRLSNMTIRSKKETTKRFVTDKPAGGRSGARSTGRSTERSSERSIGRPKSRAAIKSTGRPTERSTSTTRSSATRPAKDWSLTKKTTKKDPTKECIYGAHAIIEMLKAKKRRLISLYTKKPFPKSWERLQPYLPKSIPNIQYVEKNVLDGIAQSPDHMGVVALVSPFKFYPKMFTPKTHPVIMLLDGIQDVGNLGAILRSAYCAGLTGVIVPTSSAAPVTSAVFKASAGLAEYLDIYQPASAAQAVTELKQAGYTMYMAVIDGQNVTEVEFKQPMCLVIGNEATGINREIKKQGVSITIPQRPDVSYNASAAAGILLFFITWRLGK